jgi:diguanylate cyclase (GGDEF)-like protein/PAS domain S-box-containing protein
VFSTAQRQAAWVVGLGVALMVGGATLAQERRYAASLAAVQEALAVQQAIGDTLSLLKDAETGQRGYLLTGDTDFLGPHAKATRELPVQLAHLTVLVEADAEHAASAREIGRLAREKLEEIAQTIELRRRQLSDETLAIVREGRGRRLMVAIRGETDRMLQRQAARLGERTTAAAQGRQRLGWILLGSGALFLSLILWGMWSAARGTAEAKRSHQRLAERERALRAVADNATDLVRVIGDNGTLLYVSPSCQSILGYTVEEMHAMPPFSLLPEDERGAILRLTERVKAGDDSNSVVVHRQRSRDGTYRYFETTYCLVRSDSDASSRIQLMSRDITLRKAAEDALRSQTERLESILASMGDGVVVLDHERRLVVVNPAARQYIHQDEGEIVARDWAQKHRTYLPDGETFYPPDQGPLTRALRGETSDGVELVIYDRQNEPRALSVTARPLRGADGQSGCVAVYRDITEQRRIEADLRESEQRLRVLSEASFEGVAISQGGVIVDTNQNFAAWLGRQPYELVGLEGLSVFAPEDREHVLEKSQKADVLYEAHLLHQNGSRLPVEVRGRHTQFRGQTVRIAVLRDITERRQREGQLQQQAEELRTMSLRDELTGLYNRRGFQEHAEQQLRQMSRSKRPAAVFFVDLDGMKGINDTLGHEIGDCALVTTACVLSKTFRESDVVARLGGDEFAVFAVECDSEGIKTLRERLRQSVADLNRSGREPFQLSISVGAAAYQPSSPLQLQDLLELADNEMYAEKHARGTPPRQAARSGTRALS